MGSRIVKAEKLERKGRDSETREQVSREHKIGTRNQSREAG